MTKTWAVTCTYIEYHTQAAWGDTEKEALEDARRRMKDTIIYEGEYGSAHTLDLIKVEVSNPQD